jgi:hypothetical protein
MELEIMVSPLQGTIAKAIYSGMKGIFFDAVLTRTTPSTPDSSTPWVPVAGTSVNYTCKAIDESYSDYQIANSLVGAKDRKILILANSLSVVPQVATDTITINGVTYKLFGEVKTDPATAVWEIQGKI